MTDRLDNYIAPEVPNIFIRIHFWQGGGGGGMDATFSGS